MKGRDAVRTRIGAVDNKIKLLPGIADGIRNIDATIRLVVPSSSAIGIPQLGRKRNGSAKTIVRSVIVQHDEDTIA